MHNNKKQTNLGSAGRAPSLPVIPGICLTTEEKAWKNLSWGSSTYNTSRHSTIQEEWTVKYTEEKQ
jgi:hypothetical protein